VDTIGDDEVGVPTHTCKVVLAMGPGEAERMYAVIMPNLETVTKPVNTYVTAVREVKRRTQVTAAPPGQGDVAGSLWTD
jgi:DNA/RNA endonuclease G (NUC1)